MMPWMEGNNNMKLKPYPKYKDLGIKWIGTIPEGWEVSRVKHICSKSAEYGLNVPSDNYVDEGVRFLRTTDITENEGLIENGVYLPENKTNKECLLDTGDVLVARSGSIGTSLYFDKRKYGKCSFAGYLVRFVVNNLNNGRFLYYFTKSKSFYAQIESQSIQTTIENFNGQKYANMQISVPPLSDQTAITNFLDKKTDKIDALIEKDKKLIALLKEKRTALINHVVTKGLNSETKYKDSGVQWIGEVPEGWKVGKLKNSCDIKAQYGAGCEPEDNEKRLDYRYIRITDIDKLGRLRKDSFAYLSKENAAGYILKEGDVLFARSGATVGKSYYYLIEDGSCAYAGYLIRYKTNKLLHSKFLFYYTLSDSYSGWIKRTLVQSTIENVSAEKYNEMFLPIPSKQEQIAISEYLDKTTSKIDQTIKKIEEKIELLEEYKKSLIHYVVTGKVDVRGVN